MTNKVLYVEDTKFDRLVLTSLFRGLARDDIELQCVATVDAGLASLCEGMPDLLLLDNRVPPYGSFEQSLPLLTRAGFRGPVVLLSGLPTEELRSAVDRNESVKLLADKRQLDAVFLAEVITPMLDHAVAR